MKPKIKIPLNLSAFVAIASLVFLPYTDCGKRCSRLHQMSCEKTSNEKVHSCCSREKQQQKKSSCEKCGGACCINSLPATATVQDQTINFDSHFIPVIFQTPAVIESDITLKIIPTANSPPDLHARAQAMLCIFII